MVKISASQGPPVPVRSPPGGGLNIWMIFIATKVLSAFHPSRVGKMSTSTHGPL